MTHAGPIENQTGAKESILFRPVFLAHFYRIQRRIKPENTKPWGALKTTPNPSNFFRFDSKSKPLSGSVVFHFLSTKGAGIFDVSLDYSASAAQANPAKVNIKDKELLRRLEDIDKLGEKDKRANFKT